MSKQDTFGDVKVEKACDNRKCSKRMFSDLKNDFVICGNTALLRIETNESVEYRCGQHIRESWKDINEV